MQFKKLLFKKDYYYYLNTKRHINMCLSCPCIWVGKRSEGVIKKIKLIFENVLYLFMPMIWLREKNEMVFWKNHPMCTMLLFKIGKQCKNI